MQRFALIQPPISHRVIFLAIGRKQAGNRLAAVEYHPAGKRRQSHTASQASRFPGTQGEFSAPRRSDGRTQWRLKRDFRMFTVKTAGGLSLISLRSALGYPSFTFTSSDRIRTNQT